MRDLSIIGAGPAGLSAAIYAGAEGLDAACYTHRIGGRAAATSRIENFIGFPMGLSGPAFAHRAQRQAERMGTPIIRDRVCSVAPFEGGYRLHLQSGRVEDSRAVIVATGARYNRLPETTGARAFEGGNGVHFACTSHEVRGSRNRDALVIGGANSAGQAALYLSQFRPNVHILIRHADVHRTMSRYLVERIDAARNITVHPFCEVEHIGGDHHVRWCVWLDKTSGQRVCQPIADAYVMIGAVPHTAFLDGVAERDAKGFVVTDAMGASTNAPGIFAAGDVRAGTVKRVATAVGGGAVAIAAASQYLKGETMA